MEFKKLNESLYDSNVNYVAKETSYEMAEKIALMAKRALKLQEHEVEMLEHDINNLRSNEWVEFFAKLSDKSEVKKLFFTYAVKEEDELTESVDSGNVITWCDECGKKQRVFVKFPNPNGPFEDTEYKCERCGAINICHDEHEYNDDGTIKESLNISDYEEVNFDHPEYRIYNKVVKDGSGRIIKGLWAAQKGDEEPFEITYEQARGFQPIDNVDKLSRDMGKLILPEEELNEDLEDDFKVLIAASDHKCRLTKYDIEEAADINQLEEYIKECYQVLSEHFGASYIKYWRFTEDGIRVVMMDGTKEDLDVRGGEIVDIDESIEQPQETEDEVVYQVGTVKDDDTLAVKDLMSDKDTAINYAHELASWCDCKVRVIKDYLDLTDDEYKKEVILELNGTITEGNDSNKCIICGEHIVGYGNNAEPVAEGRCCDDCNISKVIPARISQLKASRKEKDTIKESTQSEAQQQSLPEVDWTYEIEGEVIQGFDDEETCREHLKSTAWQLFVDTTMFNRKDWNFEKDTEASQYMDENEFDNDYFYDFVPDEFDPDDYFEIYVYEDFESVDQEALAEYFANLYEEEYKHVSQYYKHFAGKINDFLSNTYSFPNYQSEDIRLASYNIAWNMTEILEERCNIEASDDEEDYDNIDEGLTESELTDNKKSIKAVPDSNVRSSKDLLKEAVKDTDYVIALYHGAGRYTFFTEHDTMTSDIKKAATYRNKMMAESDIKYAVDASQRYGTPSDDPLYEDRFSVMTIADFKKNSSAKTEYQPVDNEVLTQQKKDQEALAQFIANISKKYNISTNSICTKAKQDADELLSR